MSTLLILSLLVVAQAGTMWLPVADQEQACQDCRGPGGACDAGCVACPGCCANAPGDVVPGTCAHVPAAVADLPSHDAELCLPTACTEILHIPKPTLT